MKKIIAMMSVSLIAGLLIATSCNKTQDVQPATDNSSVSATSERPGSVSPTMQMKAYYNNVLYSVLFRGYSDNFVVSPSTDALRTVNTIYEYREYVSGINPQQFTPILSALPRTGLTPTALWQKVIITFPASRPFQVYSVEDINKLLSTGTITVTKTATFFEMELSKDQPVAIQ